jgi:hypothetical protein
MPASRSTASHASVAFLRIPDFAQHPMAEQAQLKERLEKAIAAALAVLRTDEWIVLDTSEGLAVVVLANPRGLLRFAWRAGADHDLEPAIGLAHGPVRVAQGQTPVLYGDAFLAAEGAARAAAPGGISASWEFRHALARSHPGLARALARSGTAFDAQDRAFPVYRADRQSSRKRRRNFLAWATIAAIGIVSSGVAIHATREPPPPPPAPPAPVVPEPLPGALTFDIKPEGEVYVDGVLKGKSPPLKKIQLPAGNHVIEIRGGRFKPMVTELAVGPGEEFAVTHDFVVKQPPKPPVKTPAKPRPQTQPKQQPKAQQEKGAWDRFVDWIKR